MRSSKRSATWRKREAQREKGQFWTPDWIADAMVHYVLNGGSPHIFDPAVGGGAFFRAGKRYASRVNREIVLLGSEIDACAIRQAPGEGLAQADLANIVITDFPLSPPPGCYDAIAANPPYVRHHRLDAHTKAKLQEFGRLFTGIRFDGRAGLHLYFLLRCLERLNPGGRLAFIVSADICEGIFAAALWHWITAHYRLDGVVTFSQSAAPFPDVDTNAIVLFIQRAAAQKSFGWAQLETPDGSPIVEWIESDFPLQDTDALAAWRRDVAEGIATGLSRPPRDEARDKYVLGNFARVMRGIVTGDNDFFFLTQTRANELQLPSEYLVPAIGRVRDTPEEILTPDVLDWLDHKGRPTLLLSLNGSHLERLSKSVQAYLREGESRGVPKKPLIRMRSPWYRMETRKPPHFLFAYLGRRNARFILNRASVVPLTCLHCVYARKDDPLFIETLWQILRHPKTIENLRWVGKSYGGGAIKVEPRALERLPLPTDLVESLGLSREKRPSQGQLPLLREGKSTPTMETDKPRRERERANATVRTCNETSWNEQRCAR